MKKGFTLIEIIISITIFILILQIGYSSYFNLLIKQELKKEAYYISFIFRKHTLKSKDFNFSLKNNIILIDNSSYELNNKFKYKLTNNSNLYFQNSKINSSFRIQIYYIDKLKYTVTLNNLNNLNYTNIRVDKNE